MAWRCAKKLTVQRAAADPEQDNSSLFPLIQSILLPRQLRSSSIAGVAAQSSAATTVPRDRPHLARKRRVGASASREPCPTAANADRRSPYLERRESRSAQSCGSTQRPMKLVASETAETKSGPRRCGEEWLLGLLLMMHAPNPFSVGITSYTWQRRRHRDARISSLMLQDMHLVLTPPGTAWNLGFRTSCSKTDESRQAKG